MYDSANAAVAKKEKKLEPINTGMRTVVTNVLVAIFVLREDKYLPSVRHLLTLLNNLMFPFVLSERIVSDPGRFLFLFDGFT